MVFENKLVVKNSEIGYLPADWEIRELNRVLELLKDGTHNPPKRQAKGIRLISSGEVRYRNIDFTNCTYISEEDYSSLQKYYEIKEADVLLTIVGAYLGRVAIVKRADLPFSAQRAVAILRPKKVLKSEFLFYWLTSPIFQRLLWSRVSASAQPGVFLGELGRLPIPIPSLQEQRAITDLLSSIDLKIENNLMTNRILEAVGEAVFQRWFVDFEFPDEEGKPYKSSGGKTVYNDELEKEMPKGWKVKPIDEIADFLNGLAMQKFPEKENEEFLPVIKIRELRQGISESTDRANLDVPEEYVVNDGDVLFSWSGSLEVVLWGFGKGALNQHLFKVTSSKYPKWFFYYWILEYLPEYRHIAKGKATTMGHIRRYHLTNSLVIVPDEKTLKRMDKIFAPLIEKIVANKIETRTLTEIRDSLLPKLMSGRIRVPVTEDSWEGC